MAGKSVLLKRSSTSNLQRASLSSFGIHPRAMRQTKADTVKHPQLEIKSNFSAFLPFCLFKGWGWLQKKETHLTSYLALHSKGFSFKDRSSCYVLYQALPLQSFNMHAINPNRWVSQTDYRKFCESGEPLRNKVWNNSSLSNLQSLHLPAPSH